jgi:hypothetical protein
MKFGMEIRHKDIYRLCMKSLFSVIIITNMVMLQSFKVTLDNVQVMQTFSSGNYALKQIITSSCIFNLLIKHI